MNAHEGVGPTTPVGVAAVTLLAQRMQPMFELEEAAASGTDMDAVHDMRVASRRTREALRIFSELYRREDVRKTMRDVRKVTRALGAVRDADVFCDRFTAISKGATDEAERFALAYVIGYRRAYRVRDLEAMRAELKKLDLSGHRLRILRSLHAFRGSADISTPIVWLAEDTLKARMDAFFGHLPKAVDEHEFLEQHAMRKDGKHLRYAIETFRSCIDPDRYDSLHKRVKKFQDVLGELHDRVVFEDAVREVALTCDTSGAGVTKEGLDAIVAELERERVEYYRQFLTLVDGMPEAEYRADVLGALLPGPPRPAKSKAHVAESKQPPGATQPDAALAVRIARSPLARLAALFRRRPPEPSPSPEAAATPMPQAAPAHRAPAVKPETPSAIAPGAPAEGAPAESAPATESTPSTAGQKPSEATWT